MNQGFEYRARVGDDGQGMCVLDYLVRRYARFSATEWQGRIESGAVFIDGVRATPAVALHSGQIVSWMRAPWEEPAVPTSFAILYRSDGLLAVAKPRGLPTTPGGGLFMDNTLLSLVRRRFPGASPLHRLGRGTSGIVLFATSRSLFSELSRAWQERRVVKEYRALVSGVPDADDWTVDVPIGPVAHPVLGTVNGARADGKAAHSEVVVLERRAGAALVLVRITTGRPHQIRIHMAAAGHPLVGDPLYVEGGVPAHDSTALPGDVGYHLHAARLAFDDPTSGQWTEIKCLPPPVLRQRNGLYCRPFTTAEHGK